MSPLRPRKPFLGIGIAAIFGILIAEWWPVPLAWASGAAAAFALTSGEARVVLRQRDAGILMFQQAINMARVALDPLGEVRAFKLLNIYVYVHTYVCVCTYVYTYVCMYLCVYYMYIVYIV